MRSLPSIIFAILIAGLGSSWLFFEAEIREMIGWPEKEVVQIEEEADTEPSGEKPTRIPSEAPDVVDRTSEDADPTTEEVIQRIVLQRYPDIPATPFAERFPSIEKVPVAAYPDRTQCRKSVSFSKRSGNAVLAASQVKEGGFVRPEEILADEKLVVSSLANREMTATVPLSETNFIENITENYEDSRQRAQERIVEMREADASELRSNSRLLRRLDDSPKVWSEDPVDPSLEEALFQELDPEIFSIVGHYELGRKKIQTSERFNVYSVTLFLIEGTDDGFGPYLWRIQSLESSGRVVDWLGLPE